MYPASDFSANENLARLRPTVSMLIAGQSMQSFWSLSLFWIFDRWGRWSSQRGIFEVGTHVTYIGNITNRFPTALNSLIHQYDYFVDREITNYSQKFLEVITIFFIS